MPPETKGEDLSDSDRYHEDNVAKNLRCCLMSCQASLCNCFPEFERHLKVSIESTHADLKLDKIINKISVQERKLDLFPGF